MFINVARTLRLAWFLCLAVGLTFIVSCGSASNDEVSVVEDLSEYVVNKDTMLPDFGTDFSQSIQLNRNLPAGFEILTQTDRVFAGRYVVGDFTVEFGAKIKAENELEIVFGEPNNMASMVFSFETGETKVRVHGNEGRIIMTPQLKAMLSEIYQILGDYMTLAEKDIQVNMAVMGMLEFYASSPDDHEFYTGMKLE